MASLGLITTTRNITSHKHSLEVACKLGKTYQHDMVMP